MSDIKDKGRIVKNIKFANKEIEEQVRNKGEIIDHFVNGDYYGYLTKFEYNYPSLPSPIFHYLDFDCSSLNDIKRTKRVVLNDKAGACFAGLLKTADFPFLITYGVEDEEYIYFHNMGPPAIVRLDYYAVELPKEIKKPWKVVWKLGKNNTLFCGFLSKEKKLTVVRADLRNCSCSIISQVKDVVSIYSITENKPDTFRLEFRYCGDVHETWFDFANS